MTLTYDFDICAAIPGSLSEDPQVDAMLARLAAETQAESGPVARFRCTRTAQALRDAPEGLRDYFLASGFALGVSGSDLPKGLYPAADEEARLAVIRRLTENAASHPLPAPDDQMTSGEIFRLGVFLAELTQSRPTDIVVGPTRVAQAGLPGVFETAPLPQAPADAPPPPLRFWQHRAFRLALVAGVLLGLVQLVSGPALTVLASL